MNPTGREFAKLILLDILDEEDLLAGKSSADQLVTEANTHHWRPCLEDEVLA